MRVRGSISQVLCLIIACDVIFLAHNCLRKKHKFKPFADSAAINNGAVKEYPRRKKLSGSSTSALLDFEGFSYKISNDLCNKQIRKDLLAILLITSYAGRDKFRAAHRRALPLRELAKIGFQRVFLLAALPQNERFITQDQLENEQHRFGDLVQGNFIEAYRNLSYKHVMGLNWAATSCARAKFIIKLDDDTIFDVFLLRRYLKTLNTRKTNSADLLAGLIIDGGTPIREKNLKWYVASQEFSESSYPKYLSGCLYITNWRTALRLVQEAKKTRFFWVDDVWVTGILRQSLNMPLEDLSSWYTLHLKLVKNCVGCLKEFYFECDFYVAMDNESPKLLLEFLQNVEKCCIGNCIQPPLY